MHSCMVSYDEFLISAFCHVGIPPMQAIAAALAMSGGAIALIDLDLRDNPISEAGLNALVGKGSALFHVPVPESFSLQVHLLMCGFMLIRRGLRRLERSCWYVRGR